jgi:hypothetical protein
LPEQKRIHLMRNIFLAAVVMAAFFASCQPFKMSLSERLSNAPELTVKGRNGILINQKLSFGEYKTAKVDRSWTEGASQTSGAFKSVWATASVKKQAIHFSLHDSAGSTSEVFCIAKLETEDWTVGANPNSVVNIMGEILGLDGPASNIYGVNIYLPKEPVAWEMMLDFDKWQLDSKQYMGYLAQSKERYYTIHPVTSVEKNGKKSKLPFGGIGFEIKDKSGVSKAAVSLIDNGKVYISGNDTYEKFLLANACAAILLHQAL